MDLVTPGIGLIFWQTLIFLIVLFLLSKFAWKPILSAVKEREKSIEDALQSAELAKAEMANLTSQNEALLQKAREERDAMLSQSRAQGELLIEAARKKADEEAQRMISNAKEVIDAERKSAVAEIKETVATLSIDIAEKLIGQRFADKSVQEELVRKELSQIKLN